MRLKRLKIQALPGIKSGFKFDPPGAGINIVTGPNAIGKSSLARALGYLLRGGQRDDPPALSLEAEFKSGATNWRALRNGSQVAWYRDGNPASPPPLPGAGQTGLYRLSMEHLLAGDERDNELALELRNRLRGGYNLDAPRIELSSRFAQNDEKKLLTAEKNLRQAERQYDDLERQEQEKLPRLNRGIEAAGEARERLQRLHQGLDLHKAVEVKKSCAGELKAYPADMDRLRGNVQERLAGLDKRSGNLREKLREQQRLLHTAQTALEETDLQQSVPEHEPLEAADLCLQGLGQKTASRSNARDALARADAGLKNAREPFNGAGKPPRLDAQSLGQAETVAAPLIKARAGRDVLQQKLDQAGDPPDEAEISKLYDAGSALRKWQAASAVESGSQPASPDRRSRFALWITLAASGLAALLAGMQQALPAMAAALVALGAAALGLFILRQRSPDAGSQAHSARQDFIRTGLAGPTDWNVAAVEEYLRTEIDKRHGSLVLQREQAAQAAGIPAELEKVDADITRLQALKQKVAADLGFDPELPSLSPDMFLQHCRQLFEAQSNYQQAKAELEAVERDIAGDVDLVRDFLAPWRSADAPALEDTVEDRDIHQLRASFQDLKRRVGEANNARNDIKRSEENIQSIQDEIKNNQDETDKLFMECGLETGDRIELDRRLRLLDEWQTKWEALQRAKIEEERIRSLLESHPEIIRDVEEGKEAKLRSDAVLASEQAEMYTELVRQQAEITTRLKDAGKDHRLSQARAAVDAARSALQDKREHAWLHEATELLIDDVDQAFRAENEPEVLRRARALFREITANAFDLRLDKHSEFYAHDLIQNESRSLNELSTGTRMQLLLALRLAWIEAQEQGGEKLPLFLDEALTTSDEERFAVMANSLERLAGAENRQIFYLSARRHEYALWKQVTGREAPTIDLAAVLFPKQAHPLQDYDIALPTPVPAPEGREPEAYASALGVPKLNPRLEPGAAHLFYLLRDDLDLIYQLMDNWRITSLGQLEVLLDSDAGSAAVTDTEQRNRLRRRCAVVRAWMALWRQGRGRPVNRIALEQSDAISETFIDRVANLAETVREDGKALVQALRDGEVSRFQAAKIEELEHWLAEEGYTDQQEILPAEERQRLTLQQAMSDTSADVEDLNQVITWLESSITGSE